jgi:hypothetical protein
MFALMPGIAGDAYLAGDRLREVDVASENKHKDDEHKGLFLRLTLSFRSNHPILPQCP